MAETDFLTLLLFVCSCILGERCAHAFNFWKW